jgi:Domain of unknown function (DUF6285)
MHESPSSAQLLKAVIAFLTDIAAPQLTGHAQFHARVSANALALVAREIAKKEAADTQAQELYAALLTNETKHIDLKSLEAALCEAIRSGDLNVETPNLLANLREVATAQLAIDQPNYSGLKQP